MKKSQQEIKVNAVNLLNKYAEQVFNYEQAHFNQFLGKNIFKVDGSIKEKYKHDRLEISGKTDDGDFYSVNYWFSNRYSFDIEITLCYNGGSYDVTPSTAFCIHEKRSIELFKIDKSGAISEKSDKPEYFGTSYKLEDLQETAKRIKEAAILYESQKVKMPYVFRDVFNIERLTH